MTPAEVRLGLVVALRELLPAAGASSRLTALAVALAALGDLDPEVRRRAAEVGESVARLHDLVGTLLSWSSAQPVGSRAARALLVAVEHVRVAAAELEWRQLSVQ